MSSLQPVPLRAGLLELRFEPEQLWLRDWRCGGVEVLRAAYPAIRDANWHTLKPDVRWVRRTIRRDSFSLQLAARYGGAKPVFEWDLRLEGGADGTIVYVACGVALRTFRSNRTGFCVLHVAEAAGTRCKIEHTDGRVTRTHFPREISPQQPFFDIRAIEHSPAPGVHVQVRLEGDVFETEDQRNWSDASFKTYCRPLALPKPFELPRGAKIEQRVTVRVTADSRTWRAPTAVRRENDTCVLTLPRTLDALPAIGVAFGAGIRPTKGALAALRAAQINHLRVELDAGSPACRRDWDNAVAAARQLGATASLDVALRVADSAEALVRLARHVASHEQNIAVHWLVLDRETGVTPAAAFARVAELWARHKIAGELGAGVAGGFVDFNRNRPQLPGMRFASFGVDAQVHAFDEPSIVETLSTYATAVRQAAEITKDAPISVTPIRFGTPRIGQLLREDPRHRGAFAGAWTLGAIAALTNARASRMAFSLSRSFEETPMYNVLAACAGFRAHAAGSLHSADPRSVCGILLQASTGMRILVANFRAEKQRIVLDRLPARNQRVDAKLLFADVRAEAARPLRITRHAFTLPGWSVAQLALPTRS